MTRIDLEKLDPTGDLRTIADEAGAIPNGATRRDVMRNGAIGVGGFAAGSALLGFLDPMEAFASASKAQKGAYSIKLKDVKRTSKKPTANDVVIGNFALTLEYLEAAFYAAAVDANYADPSINAAAKVLASHEAAHVKLLKTVLGKAAVKAPKLNMDAVAATLKDQETFIQTAAAIEPVGTSAYAGAGPYVSNIKIVEAALAIHSVEARHAALTAQICRQLNLGDADPTPTSFDKPRTFGAVVKQVTALKFVKGPLQP